VELVGNLLYMVAVLSVGVGARWVGLLTASRRDLSNAAAFYVALPALVFSSTHAQPLEAVLTPSLVAGLWIVLLVMTVVSSLVHRRVRSRPTRSVAVVQSYHCNLGYLGLPIVAATFGDVATAKASVLLGVGALTQVPLTIMLLVWHTDGDASLGAELRRFLRNPVILTLVAGLVVSGTGATVPAAPAGALEFVAQFALPIALLCVGGALSREAAAVDVPTVGSVVALKVFVMPAVALAVFSLLAGSASTLRAGVVMLAMPTAVSTYVYVTEYGGDERLASVNVFATTLVSLGTIFLLLRFVFV
jgi:predicted permease